MRMIRWSAATVALCLVAAACGSGGAGSSAESSTGEVTDVATVEPPPSTAADSTDATFAEIDPESVSTETTAPPSNAPIIPLPAVDVIDVKTSGEVSLPSLAPSDKPILLWFWAPH